VRIHLGDVFITSLVRSSLMASSWFHSSTLYMTATQFGIHWLAVDEGYLQQLLACRIFPWIDWSLSVQQDKWRIVHLFKGILKMLQDIHSQHWIVNKLCRDSITGLGKCDQNPT
jgi:hypothetical protein